MFDYKYQIELKTKDKIGLFGEDYFGDKSTFWNSHQATLKDLYHRVLKTGFPIQVIDLELSKKQIILDLEGFHLWLKLNQPFNLEEVNE